MEEQLQAQGIGTIENLVEKIIRARKSNQDEFIRYLELIEETFQARREGLEELADLFEKSLK